MTVGKREIVERKPLRIAMISLHSSPLGEVGTRDTGGMSIYIRELAKGLAGLGHCVDIFTRRQQKSQDQFTRLTDNVRVVHLDAGGLDPLPPPALSRHLREFACGMEKLRSREGLSYDLVHSHYWLSGLVGRKVTRAWRIPHVVLFHTLGMLKNQAFQAPIEPEARIRAERELCGECERVLATTDEERTALADRYQASRSRIAVIPCGVDLTRFRPVDPRKAREFLGVGPGDEILLYVGRFDPVKGIDDLLHAVAMLRARSSLKLMLVGGDGESASEAMPVRDLGDRLGLGDRITFAGRVGHEILPFYYSAADALVVPSHYESFGLVALESLACGTPVVATPVGAMKRLLANGRGGVLVDARAPMSLADGIRRVLADREAGRYPGDGVRTVARPFDWATIAERVEAEYQILVSERSSRHDVSPGLRAGLPRKVGSGGCPGGPCFPWEVRQGLVGGLPGRPR